MAGNPLASLPGLPQRPSLARSSASETRLTQPGIEGARSRKLNSAPTAAFRIIDYPEERRHQIRMLLQDAAVLEAPPASIRILLVSRQPASWWRGDVDAAHADVLCDAQEIGIARLGREAAVGVFREAAQRLASHFKRNISSAPDAEISSWLNRDAALHCLPLFVLGAAIHWVLEANPILGIAGGKIVESLVDREIKRLNNAARAAQWGEESGARLVGLATIRGG